MNVDIYVVALLLAPWMVLLLFGFILCGYLWIQSKDKK